MKPIQIRNEDVVRDIREAVALTHRPITKIVGEGIQLVLERERRRATAGQRHREIDRILAEIDSLPILGAMLTDDELYGEDGLPR